jgi:flap endonuclease-1
MGVRHLIRFLKINGCDKCMVKIPLSDLKGRTLVIDTSIYLYKYKTGDKLMENFYLLVAKLVHYEIIPIFVFDGKPPPEKMNEIWNRYNNKKVAEEAYKSLAEKMKKEACPNKQDEMQAEMVELKRRFIRITNDDIKKVKSLLDAFGVTYYVSDGEADVLCAQLVDKNRAWGCISDDTDMFLYGCARVYRHLSILNDTVIYYDYSCILKKLRMTSEMFREVMVMLGTDYNDQGETNMTIGKIVNHFNSFVDLWNNTDTSFHRWLLEENKCTRETYDKVRKVYQMFDLSNFLEPNYQELKAKPSLKNITNSVEVRNIMQHEGFCFV